MKKNKMMRLASSLLVAVLLTSSVISGTFAKYVTSDKAQDSARVAKWGVVVDVTGDDAFAKEYEKHDTRTNTDVSGIESITKTVVNVTDDKNLVAPGTFGYLGSVSISGTPEVAVEIETEVVDFSVDGWLIDSTEFYCPIIISITVDGTTTTINGATYGDATSFEDAVKNALEGVGSVAVEANTDLSAAAYQKMISWSWPFHTSPENDVKDTKLGNLSTAPTISFEIKTTVTQID